LLSEGLRILATRHSPDREVVGETPTTDKRSRENNKNASGLKRSR